MTEKTQFIQHVFGGGFASDFGSDARAQVIEKGTVVIPYLLDADNVIYDLDGGPLKAPGTSKINSTAFDSGAEIKGAFDLWLTGTDGTPSQHRIVHAGSNVKKDDADGSFTNIFTGLEAGKIPDYSVFGDLLILATDSSTDVPKSWDGTTAQDLAGSPPNFAFSEVHKNRLWAAGNVALPSRLYYSASENAEDWSGKGSGFIDIDPDDGDVITGLASHKGILFVFKGPYHGSIHQIEGSSPADFSKQPFSQQVGAVGNNTIFRFRDDIGYMAQDGSIRSLSATASFGDFIQSALSYPIRKWLRENLNLSRGKHFWAVNNEEFGHVLFSISVSGGATNNYTLMMDYRFDPPRWATWSAFESASLATMIDAGSQNRMIVIAGGKDGFLRKYNAGDQRIDGSTNISYKVTTPWLNYGSPIEEKTLTHGSISVVFKNDNAVTFAWQRDFQSQQSTTISSANLNGLDSFTLGTDVLGGSGEIVDGFVELTDGGQFRSIQYQFTETTVNVDLHGFGAGIDFGEGWATD